MTETGTKNISHLSISVNQATMQFVISNASHGAYDFLLPRSDVAEFLTQSAEAAKALTE